MKSRTLCQWFAPALLAAAIAPLSLGAFAAPGDAGNNGKHKGWSEGHQQRQSEHHQALFERAGIDEETRQALEAARQEHRDAIKELREEYRELMSELIDDDQRQALNDARQKMRQEMRNERRQAMQQRMEEQLEEWAISEEQQQALSDIRASFYADMQDLKDSEFDSRSERREAWQNLRQEHYAAMAEILSEEQIEELRSGMHEGMHKKMGSEGYSHHGRGKHGGSRGE